MSAFFASSTASHGQIWDVDIYVRASREDGDKEQSETISNQITMLTDFVHGRPELRLHEIRKDDGISGVTFDRPGFHAVMDDVRSGAANCVVVKDLSRFGRDYIETGKYLEEIFPFMGVRFIAVNDNYDSMGGTAPPQTMWCALQKSGERHLCQGYLPQGPAAARL